MKKLTSDKGAGSIYYAIKKRIKDAYGNGEKFSSFDMRDISDAFKRPFNDIAVRLKFLANRGIIRECGRIANKGGGNPRCQYRLVRMRDLLELIEGSQSGAAGPADRHDLNKILNNIVRNRMECIND